MSDCPEDLYYATSHEWARLEEDGTMTIGITDHAQGMLGELVYVELPRVGSNFDAGDETAVVESVKTASDVYSPVSGEIMAVNEALENQPSLINDEPYGDGWLFKIKPSDKAELDDLVGAEAYLESIEE
jgi:glycine cleavage system H protein